MNRPKEEVQQILEIVREKVEELMNDQRIHQNEVRIKFCGKLHKLPQRVVKTLKKTMNLTKGYRKMVLNFMIAYGGQYELTRAIKKLLAKKVKKVKEKGKKRVIVTPKMIEENLLVKEPLDLIIRTGGEHRLSNFMPWQASYAEIFITSVLWPAFRKEDFLGALEWYSDRKRRFGR